MEKLKLSQLYYLLAANPKARISSFSIEKRMSLLVSVLLELKSNNFISIDNKKVKVVSDLPVEYNHLKPLYDYIREKKEVNLQKLSGDYLVSFTDKKTNELIESIGKSLNEIGLAKAKEIGIFKNHKMYIAEKETINKCVDFLKKELLESQNVNETASIIYLLLDKSKLLNEYFSKFELKDLKGKMKNLFTSDNYKILKDIVDYIENVVVSLIVAST